MALEETKYIGQNSVLSVANKVVEWFNENNKKVNNLYLQKILYFLQANYMYYNNGEKLFDNKMEKWRLGPVQPDVYHAFKFYGPNDIEDVYESSIIMKEENDKFSLQPVEYLLDKQKDKEKIEFIEKVLPKISEYDTFDLVDLTHKHEIWKKDERNILNGEKHIMYDYDEMYKFFNENPSLLLYKS